MANYTWDEKKNVWLQQTRGISFEAIVSLIESGNLLDIMPHPNPERYGEQKVFVVLIGDYVWAVPAVEKESYVFLKTAFPSRTLKKRYVDKGDL